MFKIFTGKYDPQVSKFIKLNNNSITRGHPYKIEKQRIRLDVRRFSFVHRCVDKWNSLPEEVVSAPSVSAFERRLDRRWMTEPIRLDYEAQPPESSRGHMRTARLINRNPDLTPEAE